ncbi:MAG: helix-hairpin-helix domain-containing protein [Bacteroidales bacterium]
MSWKDLFYFHRTERTGIIILLVLIIVVLLAPALLRLGQKQTEVDFTTFRQAIHEFRQQQAELLARQQTELPQAAQPNEPAPSRPSLKLRLFNPNLLSQQQWQNMGIPTHISRTIQNYMKAGGSFRYKEDLARIYTIDDTLYTALEPFIDLPAKPAKPLAHAETSYSSKKSPEPVAPLVININQADTLELTRLYGIGPVFSRRIVEYRAALGGFHDVEQLMEVFGMDSTRMAGIYQHVVTGEVPLRKIDINTASFEELLHHPYISYNVANSIINLRKQHGAFQQIEDVRKSALIDQNLFLRLAPYLKTASDTIVQQEKPAL